MSVSCVEWSSMPRIALWHLMKTGGTSVYRCLSEAVVSAAAWSEELERARLHPVMGGHYELDDLSRGAFTIVTFLREPLYRVVSTYNYLQTLSEFEVVKNRDISARKSRELTFEEFITSDDDDVCKYSSNYVAKMILDQKDRSNMSEEFALFGACMERLNRLYFVGTLEKIEENISSLMSSLGLPVPISVPWEKKSSDLSKSCRQVDLQALSATQIEQIIDRNKLDYLIFDQIRSKTVYPEPASTISFSLARLPLLMPGHTLECNCSSVAFSNMFAMNWYGFEEDGIWSKSTSSRLAFFLDRPQAHLNLLIEIPRWAGRLSALLVLRHADIVRRIHVVFANRPFFVNFCEGDQIVRTDDSSMISVDLPIQATTDGGCQIDLTIDDVFIPSRHFITGDDRQLGVKLRRLEVF